MIRLIRRLNQLDADENGAAMTEFIIFLPVWGFLFAGIFALAELGIETTRVKLQANKQIWDQVIPITEYTNVDEHATVAAYGTAAAKYASYASNSSNPSQILDGVEGIAFAVGGTGGHWGESHARVLPYESLGIAEVDNLTRTPSDIVGDAPYPNSVVDDSVTDDLSPSGGFAEVLEEILTSSGAVHAAGAGIRYGAVFGEIEGHSIQVAGGVTYDASAHYDALVAPAPLTGFTTKMSFGINRLLAETEDEYSVMMNYGEDEWEGDASGGTGDYDIPDSTDVEGTVDDAEEEERERLRRLCRDNPEHPDCQ
jgi:hypothetical protein